MQFGNFGLWQILVILVVVLLIFGPRRLPDLARNMGQSIKEFRKGLRELKRDMELDIDDEEEVRPSKGTGKVGNGDINAEWEKLRAERRKLRAQQQQFRKEQATQQKDQTPSS